MHRPAINSFVRRQTPQSPFSHYIGSEAQLLDLVHKALGANQYVIGYREGVLRVRVPSEGFFTGLVELRKGDELVGRYDSRHPGETPRITLFAKLGRRQKQTAQSVEIILYHHDVLAETNECETDAEFEIVAINGFPTDEPGPIDPVTLMYNHFQGDGGTATNMSPAEFESALRESFEYHRNKCLLEGTSSE